MGRRTSGRCIYRGAIKRFLLGLISFALAFIAFCLLVAFAVSAILQDGFYSNWLFSIALFVCSALCVAKYGVELRRALCLAEGSEFSERDGMFPYVRHIAKERKTPDNNTDYSKIVSSMLYFEDDDKSSYRRELALSSFFLTALISPQAVLTSITDNITPRSRSLFVKSEIDVRIPYNLRASSFVVPVLMQERAGLPDDLCVEASSDAIVCTLNLQETIDYLIGVFKVSFPYLKDNFELCDKLRKYVSGTNDYDGEKPGLNRAKEASGLYKAYCDLLQAESEKSKIEEKHIEPIKQLFLGVLDTLLYAYPICARVRSKIGAMERDTTTKDGLCFDSSVKRNARLVVYRSYPLTKVEPRFTEREYIDKVFNWCCRRPMTLYYDLGNADRAQSYHFRAEGPEGTYFRFAGMKRFLDRKDNSLEADMAFLQRRHGQRHARFAVKDGFGFSDWTFMFGYDERPFTIFHLLSLVSLIPVLLFGLFLPEVVSSNDPKDLSGIATIAGALTVVASLAGAWIIDRRGVGQVYPVRPWLFLFLIGVAVIAIFVCIILFGSPYGGERAYTIILPFALLCTLSTASAVIIVLNYYVYSSLSKRSANAIQGSLMQQGDVDVSDNLYKLFTTWSPGWHASSYHRVSVPDLEPDTSTDPRFKKVVANGVKVRRRQYCANPNYVRDSIMYGMILLKNTKPDGLPEDAIKVLQVALCEAFEASDHCI